MNRQVTLNLHPTRRTLLAAAVIGLLGAALPVWAQTPSTPTDPAVTVPPVPRLADLGTTRRLEVLPLVEWGTSNSALRGEPGVSYLVRTDRSTILLDVGANMQSSDPSPLQANMKTLGVDLAEVDTVLITHNHMDHVGGLANARARTFALGMQPVDLAGKLHARVLGLYGGQDTGIPLDTVEKMKAALAAGSPAAKKSEFVVYPDAPHAFHADYRPSYRKDAADDGWKRCLAWFKAHGV